MVQLATSSVVLLATVLGAHLAAAGDFPPQFKSEDDWQKSLDKHNKDADCDVSLPSSSPLECVSQLINAFHESRMVASFPISPTSAIQITLPACARLSRSASGTSAAWPRNATPMSCPVSLFPAWLVCRVAFSFRSNGVLQILSRDK